MRIGEIYRYARPYDPTPEVVDDLPNYFHAVYTEGAKLPLLEAGINPIQKVDGPDGHFQNADPDGNVRLDTHGTVQDIERLNMKLEIGLEVTITDGELEAEQPFLGTSSVSTHFRRMRVGTVGTEQITPPLPFGQLFRAPPKDELASLAE